MTRQMHNSFSKRGRGFRGRVSNGNAYNRFGPHKPSLLSDPVNFPREMRGFPMEAMPRHQPPSFNPMNNGAPARYIRNEWPDSYRPSIRGSGFRPLRTMHHDGPRFRGSNGRSLLPSPPPLASFRPPIQQMFPARQPFYPSELMSRPFGPRGRGLFRGGARGRGLPRGGRGKNLTWVRGDLPQKNGEKNKSNTTVTTRKKKKPYITDEIINLSIKKRKLFIKARKSKKEEDWNLHKECRIHLSSIVREAKTNYYIEHPEEAADLNKPWINEELKGNILKKRKILQEAKKSQKEEDWDEYNKLKTELTQKLHDAMQAYKEAHPEEDVDKVLKEASLQQVASNDEELADSVIDSDGEEPPDCEDVDNEHVPSLIPEAEQPLGEEGVNNEHVPSENPEAEQPLSEEGVDNEHVPSENPELHQ